MDRFNICLPYSLAQECPFPNDWDNPHNFSNDARDPGGKTKCGIIQREYDSTRKHNGLPTRDVRLMTKEEGTAIYYAGYWLPYCPLVPVGLDMQFFDTQVNEGTHRAIEILQDALGIVSDGSWGNKTAAAVAAIKDVPGIIKAYTARRNVVYRHTANFNIFGKDWIRRDATIGDVALAMAANAPALPEPKSWFARALEELHALQQAA